MKRFTTGNIVRPANHFRRLCFLPSFSSFVAASLLMVGGSSPVDAQSLADLEQLAAKGRYAEALPALKQLDGLPARLLQYDIELLLGQHDQAAATLATAQRSSPNALPIVRREATQLVNAARWSAAHQAMQASAPAEQDPVLRWLAFECALHEAQWNQPQRALAWFTTQDITAWQHDVPALLAIARGITEHARWSRESRWFDVAVNDVLGRAEGWHPHDARIPSLRAELFAAKHNEPAALDSIQVALAANASAPDVHYLRAQLALAKFDLAAVRRSREQMAAIAGTDLRVRLLDAAIAFAELRPEQAAEILFAAWEKHPEHPQVLGGLLAIHEVAQGTLTTQQLQRLEQLPAVLAKQGRGAVHAYVAQGAAYEYMRHIRFAEQAYRRAFELAPEFPGVQALWVQQLLRLNENDRVPELLQAAMAEDPFDVRLKNTVAVWEVLQNYAWLETEHFMIRFDRAHDELLAKYMSQYLEAEVYPALVARFGYAPQSKSIFEIYNRARNTSGHGWFSARMVGLPGLHTVGACSGNLVAIASPTSLPQPYHWARVVKHEFVHRMNMEQTNYFVPHWITEGLAVDAEERSPPDEWMRLVTQRYKEQKLFTLDDINFGFIRPATSEDRTLAYAQAELYIRYLRETYGSDCLKKLLEHIAQQRSPTEALERATSAKTAEIEQGYREYLAIQIKKWNLLDVVHSTQVEKLREAVSAAPQNGLWQGELALASFEQGALVDAKRAALAALKLAPQTQSASLVLAKLALREKDLASAQQFAMQGLNLAQPHADLLMLLIELKLKAQQWSTAEKLLLLGRKHYPLLRMWDAGLHQVYVATDNSKKLREVLEREAAQLEEDPAIPLQLATLAQQQHDWNNVQRWAIAALHIDVKSPRAHALLATALYHRGAYEAALPEFASVSDQTLQPAERFLYAKTLIATGNKAPAKALVEQLIRTSPDMPGLVELAREIEP